MSTRPGPRRGVIALLAAAAISLVAAVAPAAAVNYGDSYGWISIAGNSAHTAYDVGAHDLKADGRRFCGQVGNSTLTSVAQVCATTSSGAKFITRTSAGLYWFRLCHQTYPNVPTTDMRYTALTCTSWQRPNLGGA